MQRSKLGADGNAPVHASKNSSWPEPEKTNNALCRGFEFHQQTNSEIGTEKPSGSFL